MIVVYAILIIIVAAPFLIMAGSEGKHKSFLSKGLKILLNINNATASKTSVHTNFALAVDNQQQKLYYFEQSKTEHEEQVIDLKLYDTVRVDQEVKHLKNKEKHIDNIEAIYLVLSNSKTKTSQRVKLYHEDDSLQLSGEIAIAQEWKDYLQPIVAQHMVPIIEPVTSRKSLDFSRIAAL